MKLQGELDEQHRLNRVLQCALHGPVVCRSCLCSLLPVEVRRVRKLVVYDSVLGIGSLLRLGCIGVGSGAACRTGNGGGRDRLARGKSTGAETVPVPREGTEQRKGSTAAAMEEVATEAVDVQT